NGFIAFRGDGSAPHWPGAYFDDVRNWVFVHALITDGQAHVTHIFVAAPLRARLLAIAEHLGTPLAVRVRAAEIMVQPRGALPHDDHFHVRIACPSRMQACVEYPTRAVIAAAHAPAHHRGGAPAGGPRGGANAKTRPTIAPHAP